MSSSSSVSLYDVIIIGGGPAGLSAALTLGRSLRKTLLFDDGHPRNGPAEHSHGFLTRDGASPTEIRSLGKKDVAAYPTVGFKDEQVTKVEPLEPSPSVPLSFKVSTATASYTSRRVIFASGLKDTVPEIPGLKERWGKDVFHCPYCHGYEFKGQSIGLLCAPPLIGHMGPLITQWSPSVTLFAKPGDLSDETAEVLKALRVKVVVGDVDELLVESNRVVGFRMKSGETHPFDALLISTLPLVPNDSILRSPALSCEVDSTPFGEWVKTNRTGETSKPGVFACGNVIDAMQTIAMAVSSGVSAGVGVNASLVEETAKVELERYRQKK